MTKSSSFVSALAGSLLTLGTAAAITAAAWTVAGAVRTHAADSHDRGGGVWGANYFPNIPLTTQNGEKVRFFDLIKNKVVAVNFIYTKCSDSCPMETARMAEVEKLLGDRMGKDVFFYSISIDPKNDTPARLTEYSKLWHTGPGWTFLTGKEEDVTLLRVKLGVYEADLKKKDHNLGLLIGNQATGQWIKRSPFENPYILATQLGSWLHNWKQKSSGGQDYEDAPEIRNISTGEETFRARCASCHTVGPDDTSNADARRTGPDLFGVVGRRDRAWLEHWIMEPDKMLADKDPLASALLAEYKSVAMPNLRMGKSDVDAVLQYLTEAAQPHARGQAEAVPEPVPGELGSLAPATSQLTAATFSPVFAFYDTLRERLVHDDLSAAKAQVAPLVAAATDAARATDSAAKTLQAVADAARSLGAASDLDAARSAFGELSKHVVQLLVQHPALRQGRHLFVCPMTPGYKKWLQASETLANPYMGTRMPHCGIEQSDWSADSPS